MATTAQLTIGDFSRATSLSVKTLRHYHRVGLLEPVEVGLGNGYRYYTVDQVPVAHVIRRLRDLGMPVPEVAEVLRAPDVEARNTLIAGHLERLEQQLERTRGAADSLRRLLVAPEPQLAIERRAVPATPVLAIGETVTDDELSPWLRAAREEIRTVLTGRGVRAAGPAGGLYANDLFLYEEGEAVAFVPVPEPLEGAGRVRPMVLPAAELAIKVHHGTHEDVDLSYGALASYVASHAIGVEGSIREYYTVPADAAPSPSDQRTEICWPIFRTAA